MVGTYRELLVECVAYDVNAGERHGRLVWDKYKSARSWVERITFVEVVFGDKMEGW